MDLGGRKAAKIGLANLRTSISGLRGVRALVLVGGRPDEERFGEFPLALLDVLGRNVLMRTLDRIRVNGIGEIAVVSDTVPLPPQQPFEACTFTLAAAEQFWAEALQQFRRLSRQSESVLIIRLGAWAEVNYPAMVSEHRCSGTAITRACTRHGEPLDIFVVSSSSQTEAAALLRGELKDDRIEFAEHNTFGYVNPLHDVASLRTLALDAFAGASKISPCGREMRPGVWVGRGAHIHREARIVAPAFIGDGVRVRDAVVVTRGSSLERHSEVDCATMIDNSSLLPYTRIGAGLELERTVAGFKQVHSLQRNATVPIEDPHILALTTARASRQFFSGANWLINFLPNFLWKLFFEPRTEPVEAEPEVLKSRTPTLEETLATADSQPKSYREMVVTRRYGNE